MSACPTSRKFVSSDSMTSLWGFCPTKSPYSHPDFLKNLHQKYWSHHSVPCESVMGFSMAINKTTPVDTIFNSNAFGLKTQLKPPSCAEGIRPRTRSTRSPLSHWCVCGRIPPQPTRPSTHSVLTVPINLLAGRRLTPAFAHLSVFSRLPCYDVSEVRYRLS